MANHWMLNTSFSYNSTQVHNGFAGAADQHHRRGSDQRAQARRVPVRLRHAGSGLGNVYVNAKWLSKVSGLYSRPATSTSRRSTTRGRAIRSSRSSCVTRGNGGGNASVLLDKVGENRLPTYQNVDSTSSARSLRPAHFVPSLDLFNLSNNNTVQALQRQQNAATANNISAVVAPRVLRFGIRVNW